MVLVALAVMSIAVSSLESQLMVFAYLLYVASIQFLKLLCYGMSNHLVLKLSWSRLTKLVYKFRKWNSDNTLLKSWLNGIKSIGPLMTSTSLILGTSYKARKSLNMSSQAY